jgi:hypothetical protein
LLLEAVAVAGFGAEGEVARDDEGVVGFLDFGGEESGRRWVSKGPVWDGIRIGTISGRGVEGQRTFSPLLRAARILPVGPVRPASGASDALKALSLVFSASRWCYLVLCLAENGWVPGVNSVGWC